VSDKVVVAFPRSHPFKQSDFYPDPTFLAVDGAPMVLFPNAAILIDYTDGSADVIPVARLKADNHADLTYLDFVMMVGKSARDYRPAWFEHMPPPRNHPESWPFDVSDFPRGAEFLKVDGAPMVLMPDATLISYRGGKAHPVSNRVVSTGKYVPLSYGAFKAAFDGRSSVWEEAEDLKKAAISERPAGPNLHLDHPLNKLALAMIDRWSHRQTTLMPVLELALEAVPEGLEDGPEGQTFDRATRCDPETVLHQLSEAFQPEDLLDATDLKDAAQMILNALEGSGEITDSQLYREREERDE
jgi:hypothetical protein